MKRGLVILLVTAIFSCTAVWASYDGKTPFCFDFNRVTVGEESGGSYPFLGYDERISQYNIYPGQVKSVDTVSGILGKGGEDKSLHISFSEYQTNQTTNPWSQLDMSLKLKQTLSTENIVHISGEIAERETKSGISMFLRGTDEQGNSAQLSYQQIYPCQENKKRSFNSVFMKFGAWFYYADMEIGGQRFFPEKWYRFDVLMDLKNESYGGEPTISYYLDGNLRSVGLLDANRTTPERERIKTIDGVQIVIAPELKQDEQGFWVSQKSDVYLDNFSINVQAKMGDEPDYYVDGKPSGGSYRAGSTVTIAEKDARLFAGSFDETGERLLDVQNAVYDDSEKQCLQLGDGRRPVQLFLWNEKSLKPKGKDICLVPFNQNLCMEENFEGMSSGMSSVEIIQSGSAVAVPAFGKFGKDTKDCALEISNSGNMILQGETGVEIFPGNLGFEKDDTVTISFDFAMQSAHTAKALTAKTRAGELLSLVDFYSDGRVFALGAECRELHLNTKQWYHVDLVLNADIYSPINTCSMYINGKCYLKNIPFQAGEKLENKLEGISDLKLTYYPIFAENTNVPLQDGFWLDNIKIQTMKKSRPQFCDFRVSAKDALWNMLIDNTDFTVEDYGQDPESFLRSLEKGYFLEGNFVDENGKILTTLSGSGNGYLRLKTENGYEVYYNLVQGTDESVKESIGGIGDANPDTSNWYPYTFPDITKLARADNPMNAAGTIENKISAHGHITTSGENFIGSKDGERVNFWGTNLIMSGCFPEHEEAERMADMIAQQGFNLVRFHQISGAGNFIFEKGTLNLSDKEMDKLCYMMKQLRDRGIYYFLDLDINKLPEGMVTPMPDRAMAVVYFDSEIQALVLDYAERLLTYPDPYDNGRRIGDNPALAAIACVNETNLFMDHLERETHYDYYYDELNRMWNDWLQKRYSTEAERMAYNKNLYPGESIDQGTVALGTMEERNYYPVQRIKDVMMFLNSKHEELFGKVKGILDRNGMQVLMTGTTLFGMLEPQVLKSNLTTDFVDMHGYWAHPNGFSMDTGVEMNLDKNNDQTGSSLKDPNLGIIQRFMERKPYNKPYTITEWNYCASSRYLAEGPLLMAAYSKFQNWHPMEFLFLGSPRMNYTEERISDVFALNNHPIRIGTMPAAAMLRQNVSEAKGENYTDYSHAEWYDYQSHKPGNAQNQWSNFDMFAISSPTGMVHKTGISLLTKPKNTVFSVMASDKYVSDTGELCFDSTENCFTVDTVESEAVTAFFGGKTFNAGASSFQINNEFATVYVNALDKKPIEISRRLLLTAAGKAVSTGQVLSRDGTKVLKQGTTPILVEPIVGKVCIRTETGEGMKTYILDSSGQRVREIPTRYSEGKLIITLSDTDRTMNYEIVYE